MLRQLRRRLSLLASPAMLLGALARAAAVAAQSSEGAVQFSAEPVGEAGEFFDLTMKPGPSAKLRVELGNQCAAAIAIAKPLHRGEPYEVLDRQLAASATWTGS